MKHLKGKYSFIIVCLVLSAQQVWAKPKTIPPKTPTISLTGNKYYDSFLSAVAQSKDSSIDLFLQKLSGTALSSGQESAKVLFYKSRSRHGSSFESPRALVMYGNGDLVISFNGTPDQKLYQSLEVMGFNKNKNIYEFREISFKKELKEGNHTHTADEIDDAEFENGFVKVRMVNSGACLECHGFATARPIWDFYLAWKGSFGSFEESHVLDKPRFASTSTNLELSKLRKFLHGGDSQPAANNRSRYKHFNWGYQSDLQLSSSKFGVLLNYRMAFAAVRTALNALKLPKNERYKNIFVAYMLNCNDGIDNPANLSNLISSISKTRRDYERATLKYIKEDHESNGDQFSWKIPISLSQPEVIFKLARMTAVFQALGIDPDMLSQNYQSSHDGYNELPDHMSEYFFRYYNLPSLTRANQFRIDKGVRRDLEAPLQDEDYQSIVPEIQVLNLPAPAQTGNRQEICRILAR